MEAEIVMEKVIEWMNSSIGQMIASVEEEDYEMASIIRNDLDKRIDDIKKKLISKKLTKLTEEEVDSVFRSLKLRFIKDWSDYFNIDENKRIRED